MSMFVALQSVLYYVVACSPCRQCAYRRRRKREAALAKRQRKNELETDEPGLYRHPSPFSTNIYWREELALGPGPPQKKSSKESKGNNYQQQQRRLITAGTGSSLGSATSHGDGSASTMTMVGGGGGSSLERTSVQDRYHERHQREDEVLWGYGGYAHLEGRPDSVRGVGGKARARGTTSPEAYHHVKRNPPVNELHPPIVSTQPTTRSESRWMLQPPPSARVMSGKAWASRVQSGKSGDDNGGRVREKNAVERRRSAKTAEDDSRRRQEKPRRDIRAQNGSGKKRRRKPAIHFDGVSDPEGMEARGYSSDDDADVEDSGDESLDDEDEDEINKVPDSPSLVSRRRRSEPPLGTVKSGLSSIVDPPTTEDGFKSRNETGSRTTTLRKTVSASQDRPPRPPLAAAENSPSLKMLQELVVPGPDDCHNVGPNSISLSSSQPSQTITTPAKSIIITDVSTPSPALPPSASSPTGNLNFDFRFPCSPSPTAAAADTANQTQGSQQRYSTPPLSQPSSTNHLIRQDKDKSRKKAITTDPGAMVNASINNDGNDMNVNVNSPITTTTTTTMIRKDLDLDLDLEASGIRNGFGHWNRNLNLNRTMEMETVDRNMWRWSMDI